jgi:hypothetical protein
MFYSYRTSFRIVIAFSLWAGAARAQVVPWDSFADSPISNSVCSVVNAGNAEFVVLRATGQLRRVTGNDLTFTESFVDAEGFVFFNDEPAGLLEFATDDDGFRTLWWLTLTGTVIEIDPLTGEPVASDRFPDEFKDVPCDACELWDDQTICVEPPPTVRLCGVDVPVAMTLSLLGLSGLTYLRQPSRRRR